MDRNLINPMEFLTDEEKSKTQFKSLLKSPEEKIYIILSVIDEDFNSGVFDVCIGRTECYRKLSWLLETYPEYDVDKSIILVESRGINLKTNTEEYFMNNYNGAASVYSFCKQVEQYYENRDDIEFIEIDNYKTRTQEDIEIEEQSKSLNGKVGTTIAPASVNQEAYDIWNEVFKQNN